MGRWRGQWSFLVCFAMAMVPGFALVLDLVFALYELTRGDGDPDDRRWGRRLLALAAADALVVAALVGLTVGGLAPQPPAAQRVIGVGLDGARVERLYPGLPAERAGVRVGDQVIAVDGKPAGDTASLRRRIAEAPRGRAVTVRVRRDGAERDLAMTPTVPAGPGAFEPSESRPTPMFSARSAPALAAVGAALLLAVALGWLGRRRRGRVAPFAIAIATFVASAVGGVGAGALLGRFLGGQSVGTVLVGLAVQSAATAAFALAVWRRWRPALAAAVPPVLPLGRAVGLGTIGLLGGWLRLGALVACGRGLAERFAPSAPGEDLVALLSSPRYGIGGMVLLVGAGVVLAPLAEELLFRAVLLPALATWLRPWRALAASAALFALLHIPAQGVGAAVVIAWIALVLGWVRLRSGRLLPSVLLHALVNATSLTLSLGLHPKNW